MAVSYSLCRNMSRFVSRAGHSLTIMKIPHASISSSTSLNSGWPPQYVDPIFQKDKLEALLKSEDAEKYTHYPIKAAKNDQHNSVFRDETVWLFRNYLCKKGKKELGRKLLNQTFEKIKRKQVEDYHKKSPEEQLQTQLQSPVDILKAAIANCSPMLQLVTIRRGGVNYQVPVPVKENQARFLAIKWILETAGDKGRNVKLPDTLSVELMDAASNVGKAVKKKLDLHRQCEANRAYAHYRWS